MVLEGRVAVITGAGRGIGQGIALRFAQEGARLVVQDIEHAHLEDTSARLRAAGAEFVAVAGDVSVTADVERCFETAVERFGALDVAVNNAGIGGGGMPVLMTTDEDFDRVIAVNLRGVFLCARAAGRRMAARGRGGRIISVASQAGKTGYPLLGAYSATKAGVLLLTQVLAKELAPSKITVNAICPGTIDTPLLRGGVEVLAQAQGATFEEVVAKLFPPIPLGRVGTPADVAKLVTFLASDEADYMTGQAINITGGQEMH